MVELALLQVGETFERALVRLQDGPNKYRPSRYRFVIRQEPPLEYTCKVEDPNILMNPCTITKWARSNLTLGAMIWISGTKRDRLKLDVTDVWLCSDGVSIAAQPHGGIEKCFSFDNDVAKRKIMEDEPGTLLRHVLEYVLPGKYFFTRYGRNTS